MNRYDLHAGLVDSMAQAQGIDLDEAQARGDLEPERLDDAVLRCTGCAQVGACQHWLATDGQEGAPRPDYCRNGELFRDLGAPR